MTVRSPIHTMTAEPTKAQPSHRHTGPTRSRCSRASKRSASAPACTSARPGPADSTTSCRRSSTTRSTRRWPATATRSSSRSCPTAPCASSTTAAASRSTSTRPRASRPSRSSSPCCTPAASSAAAATRSRAVCTASARRSSTRSRAGSRSRCAARATCGASPTPAACPRRRSRAASRATRPARRSPSGRAPTSSRPSTSSTRRCAPASSRWRSSTRACASTCSTSVPATSRSTPTTGGDEADGATSRQRNDSFLYERGLVDYVEYLNRSQKADHVNDEVIDFESEDTDRKIALEVAMQWTTSYTENVFTYANTINTHEGGTHEEGFRAALTTLVNKYARAKNLLKEKDENLSGDDVREGLTAVISIKLSEPQFEGQTKTKLGNTEAKAFVQKVVGDRLGDWFDRNPMQAKNVIRKAIDAATARLAARKARETARRKSAVRVGRHARQAQGLHVEGPVDQRDLPRRGRLGRRLGGAGSRPAHAGDPGAARQDPQRRARAPRPRPRQPRGAGDDPGLRHRHRRGLRHREGAVPQDRADGRCRRRRPAHHDAAAHAAVPLHARAHRGRLRLPRAAAAVPAQVVERRPRVRLQRPRARRAARRRAARPASGSRRTTASSATRVSAR